MRKRVIGGLTFALTAYVLVFTKLFVLAEVFFLIFGLIELWNIASKKSLYTYFYFLIFILGLFSMYRLNKMNITYIFILISFIMLSDTFAYLIGKKIGKTKFSKVSPNKTIEGVIGGLVVSEIIFILYLLIFEKVFFTLSLFSTLNIFVSVSIMALVILSGVAGDILESKLKRLNNKKDSGTIIYGHGGILDRIDSWLLGAITLYIVLIII